MIKLLTAEQKLASIDSRLGDLFMANFFPMPSSTPATRKEELWGIVRELEEFIPSLDDNVMIKKARKFLKSARNEAVEYGEENKKSAA